MTRNQRILLAGLILAALILIFPTIGHCTPTCQQLAQVTLTGTIGGANGLPASNYTMTLVPSQQGFIADCQVNIPTNNTCATSTDGSVVFLPNPQTATVDTTSGSGSLGSGVYYTVYAWYYQPASTVLYSLPSPETVQTLSIAGSLVVNPPSSGVPAGALGMAVYISTVSGAEKLQGYTTGSASFVQSTALASGANVPASNTTVCAVTANDSIWPTGTGYNVSLTDQYGNPVPNYPMQWQLMGSGSTINLSNGLPYYHGVVAYGSFLLASPPNHGIQSATGPFNFGGYNLTGVGKLGVGTGTPGWGVDVEGSGLGQYINAKGGYLFNGAAPLNHILLGNGTSYIDSALPPAFLGPNPNTPTIAWTSPANGTLASGSNDGAGEVIISAGNGSGGGLVFTLTFGGTYAEPMYCTFSSAVSGTSTALFLNTGQVSYFQLFSPTSALSGTGTISYLCHQ